MKRCPYCAEEIQDEAIKCRYCSEFLDDRNRKPGPPTSLPWYFKTSSIVISLLSVGPFALPLVWWHPRLNLWGKAAITIGMAVLSWGIYQAMLEVYQAIEQYAEMFKAL